MLIRIGAGYNFEIRLGLSGWSQISSGNMTNSYLNDLAVEAKYQLTEKNLGFPFAILLVSTLPTGDDQVSVGETEFGIRLAGALDVNDNVGIAANVGSISVSGGDEKEILSLASLAAGFGLSKRLSSFVELFAEIPQNEPWKPVIDGGFTYLITPKTQLDLYVGRGLNKYSPDLIIGAGFSFQFGI